MERMAGERVGTTAIVTAEAHAAFVSRSSTVLVGEAIATAAHAAKPKVNFILSN